MIDIQKTYTIRWIGPFHSLYECDVYLTKRKQGETCAPELFSFYYFKGIKKGKGFTYKKLHDYFGIHKKHNNIKSRLNKQHEHYCQFHENKNMDIWLGTFANCKDQEQHRNIEDVETLFISTWKPSENKHKKNAQIKESICVINLWYKINVEPWKRKPQSIKDKDDVLICEIDENFQRFLSASLKEVKK